MTKLNMKIHRFDEQTGSLLVSFCTDKSMHPIDEYPIMAFQPASMGVTDPDEARIMMARTGLRVALAQDKKEAAMADPSSMDRFKSMAGQTYTFDGSELELDTTSSNGLTDIIRS